MPSPTPTPTALPRLHAAISAAASSPTNLRRLSHLLSPSAPLPSIRCLNTLLMALARHGMLSDMESLAARNLHTYTTLINAYCLAGDLSSLLRAGLAPESHAYTSFVLGYCRMGPLAHACGLFLLMPLRGCARTPFTYAALLQGLCGTGMVLREAMAVFAGMRPDGLYIIYSKSLRRNPASKSRQTIVPRRRKPVNRWIRRARDLVRPIADRSGPSPALSSTRAIANLRRGPILWPLPSPSTPAPPSSSRRGWGPSGPGDPRARRSGCRRTRSGASVRSVLRAGGSRGLRTGEPRSCGRGLPARAPRHGCALDDVSAVHRWSGAGASRAFLRST
ncbi:unnamed protein product [Miscanthus lutarioriparius]|uniref:Pentatricopeptide repeat-containing protein n=1 Tax=Miscanthus lutarioriparius TaxID=422564 RepID=A0A811R571_9POAL|nr:unnamed protein product [Miscanthus lutarioriparius]